MYDVNETFVKKWTQGTGCSLAVFMSKSSEAAAKFMLSHSWGEDVEELQQAVAAFCNKKGVDYDAPLWFCVFSNYQCGDGAGPSIQEQIDMDPFAKVIEAPAQRTKTATATKKSGRGRKVPISRSP